MEKYSFSIEKTARYFQLGEINENTEDVYIVLHGYAQLANYFLKWFEPAATQNNVIIAPEGLHRFYWNGFSGRVVASWMTKEDRLDDIKDYVNYLNTLVSQLQKGNYKLHLIGFSQGSATALRWITMGNIQFDSLSLWAGAFPEDIDYFEKSNLLNELNIHLIIGDQDEYYNPEKINELKRHLNNNEISYKFIGYSGNHKVMKTPLIQLFESLKAN